MDRDKDWTAGYVTELEYTYGYYRELSPSLLRLACLSAGVAPPSTKQLNYLELGYGQGLSINIHAAALDGEFWGTDFNPTQVTHARALSDASGSGAKLFETRLPTLLLGPICRTSISLRYTVFGHGYPTKTAASLWISSDESSGPAASFTSATTVFPVGHRQCPCATW